MFTSTSIFLLTHPSRGATGCPHGCVSAPIHFYSHTPHGVQPYLLLLVISRPISTHTPLTGCNAGVPGRPQCMRHFYSHTPHGVQPQFLKTGRRGYNFYSHTPHGVQLSTPGTLSLPSWISTHTPLTGCNILRTRRDRGRRHFYSHTPHGVQRGTITRATATC